MTFRRVGANEYMKRRAVRTPDPVSVDCPQELDWDSPRSAQPIYGWQMGVRREMRTVAGETPISFDVLFAEGRATEGRR